MLIYSQKLQGSISQRVRTRFISRINLKVCMLQCRVGTLSPKINLKLGRVLWNRKQELSQGGNTNVSTYLLKLRLLLQTFLPASFFFQSQHIFKRVWFYYVNAIILIKIKKGKYLCTNFLLIVCLFVVVEGIRWCHLRQRWNTWGTQTSPNSQRTATS